MNCATQLSKPYRPKNEPAKTRRLTGKIVRIHPDGYGFIQPDGGGQDLYVAISSMRCRTDWVENNVVDFLPGPHPKNARKAQPAYDVAALVRDAPLAE